jgi:hypothetical protein
VYVSTLQLDLINRKKVEQDTNNDSTESSEHGCQVQTKKGRVIMEDRIGGGADLLDTRAGQAVVAFTGVHARAPHATRQATAHRPFCTQPPTETSISRKRSFCLY